MTFFVTQENTGLKTNAELVKLAQDMRDDNYDVHAGFAGLRSAVCPVSDEDFLIYIAVNKEDDGE